jgi:hypothetical protein
MMSGLEELELFAADGIVNLIDDAATSYKVTHIEAATILAKALKDYIAGYQSGAAKR